MNSVKTRKCECGRPFAPLPGMLEEMCEDCYDLWLDWQMESIYMAHEKPGDG